MPTKQTKNSQRPTLAELWASIQPFTPETSDDRHDLGMLYQECYATSDEELECLLEAEREGLLDE